MSDELKLLIGKNPKDYTPIAHNLINTPDVELFAELVDKDEFLFDFVKQNVADRLLKECNEHNYMNLLQFLKYYSPSYENFIISVFVKYANEDLTDILLDKLENGTTDEKIYCAKYFSYIKDPLALKVLKENAYSENPYLSNNCVLALKAFGDTESYKTALSKLKSNDEYEQLSGVKFLVSYGNKDAVPNIIQTMKKSPFADNIAIELPYLMPVSELMKQNKTDGLYVLNIIIEGLGEVSSLAQVFDFNLYENFETLINEPKTSQSAVVLLNAIDKFNTLTDNDEYLFDETKDTKREVNDIKNLLNSLNYNELQNLASNELKSDSLFVYTILELTDNADKVQELLNNSNNQTIILKSVEVLKRMNALTPVDKNCALRKISNKQIKEIILAV